MKKPKQEAQFYCPKCGWVNEPIEGQSNENWKVVNPQCDKCGTQISIRLVDAKK